MDLDTAFSLLKNPRRRKVIVTLDREPGGSTRRDLVRRIAAAEEGVPVGHESRDKRASVNSSLHQGHLPRLDQAGVIEYDETAETEVKLVDDVADVLLRMLSAADQCRQEIRADGFGTIVDRDGNPFEARPDLAGEHRDDDDVDVKRNAPHSKWPDVREALLEYDRQVIDPHTLAELAGTIPRTSRRWLRALVRDDLARKFEDDSRKPEMFCLPDDREQLPETLHYHRRRRHE